MKKINKQIISCIILIIPCLILLISVSFAWFVDNESSNVEQLESESESVNSISIKLPNGVWGDEAVEESGFVLSPVISDGTVFYDPIFSEQTIPDEKIPGVLVTTEVLSGYESILDEDLIKNKNVYRTTFEIVSTMDNKLILNPSETKVRPVNPDFIKDGIVNNDYVCGGLRVALRKKVVVDEIETWETLFIWIPNTTYELTANPNSYYSVTDQGTVEDSYYFLHNYEAGVATGTTVETNGQEYGSYQGTDCLYLWGDLSQIENLNDLFNDSISTEPNVYQLVVWLDGADRECNNALMGGKFTIKLAFTYEELEENNE